MKWLDNLIMTFLLIMMLFGGYMIVRNFYIFNIRNEALEIYHNKTPKIGQFDDYGTYDDMMWELGNWSFEEFYPNLDRGLDAKDKRRKIIRGDI